MSDALRLRSTDPGWDEITRAKRFWFRWYARYYCWVYNVRSGWHGDGERFYLEAGTAP